MKQQVTITNFFKLKSCPGKDMQNKPIKKRNLSSRKTPTKSPKTLEDKRHEIYVVDLNETSSSSDSTVIYSPESRTPQTSISVSRNLNTTPISCPARVQTHGSSNFGPSPKPKFYSPTRKRSCAVKSPIKAKRNLNHTLSRCKASIYDSDDFVTICKGLNDKTIFLLKIIYQFIHDKSLMPLLEEKSVNLLSNALRVKKPGMHLVCRLYWRQDKWQRLDSIMKILSEKNKMDNHTLHGVLNSLAENDLLSMCNENNQKLDLGFDELVKILKLDELKAVCKELNIKNNRSKEEIIESLKNFQSQKTNITHYLLGGSKSTNETRLLKVLSAKVGVCYKLSDEARNTLKELYILMYLGINENIFRDKGLELMLINDKAIKETYPIDKNMELDNANVVFKSREEFKSYVYARDIREEYSEETNVTTKCLIVKKVFDLYKAIDEEKMTSYMLLSPWLHRFTPPYIYIKLLEEGIKDLKKDKIAENINLAVDILSTLISQNLWRQRKKAGWYAEKALILDKLMSKSEEAAILLLEGFRSNMNEINKDVLRPRALVLAKRQTNAISDATKTQLLEFANKEDILEKNIEARHFYKQPMESSTKGKKLFKTHTSTGMSVCEAEECCIQHYIELGLYTHGQHWEGKIVTAIFFLLFWDIIYSKLRGVSGIFLSYYQMFPLDMFTESFYTNRKTLIEARLKEIESFSVEQLLAEMKSVWESRPEHEQSPISRICWESVSGAGAALGARGAAALCRRAARDGAGSGFPDLTLWNVHTGEIAFVEVKTDSDKPSLKQLQWMHYLKRCGLRTEFCYIGVHTDRQHARAPALLPRGEAAGPALVPRGAAGAPALVPRGAAGGAG